MNITNIIKLFTLAAIWGGSFIFMRIVAPAIGAIMTTNMRLLIASFILFGYYAIRSIHVDWKSSWKQYVVVGLVNSAIPFTLYAFAIQHIPASYAVVLNTTTPLFAALLAWMWLGEGMTWKKMAGLVIAVFGVAFVVRVGGAGFDDYFYVAVAACLGATICYALAGVYVKKYAAHVKPLSMAASSQLMAAILMVPLSVFQPLPQSIGTDIIINLLGLAILSSAVAYILFYQLVAEIGPTRTMTVAYLMPVFGMIWAAIFLGETITSSMIFGTALVLVGVALVIQTKRPQ